MIKMFTGARIKVNLNDMSNFRFGNKDSNLAWIRFATCYIYTIYSVLIKDQVKRNI